LIDLQIVTLGKFSDQYHCDRIILWLKFPSARESSRSDRSTRIEQVRWFIGLESREADPIRSDSSLGLWSIGLESREADHGGSPSGAYPIEALKKTSEARGARPCPAPACARLGLIVRVSLVGRPIGLGSPVRALEPGGCLPPPTIERPLIFWPIAGARRVSAPWRPASLHLLCLTRPYQLSVKTVLLQFV
jgi:hypothetical protein